jgi:hypothetical protein
MSWVNQPQAAGLASARQLLAPGRKVSELRSVTLGFFGSEEGRNEIGAYLRRGRMTGGVVQQCSTHLAGGLGGQTAGTA